MSSNDDIWSAADAAEFRRLNRKRMKLYRDKNRVRKYSPRQTKRKYSPRQTKRVSQWRACILKHGQAPDLWQEENAETLKDLLKKLENCENVARIIIYNRGIRL